MSFVIKKVNLFFWPVNIKTPKDGGGFETQKLELQFKKLKQSEFKELLEKPNSVDLDLCKAFVVGWRGVVDEQNSQIAFSEEAFGEVIDQLGFPAQIIEQYREALQGVESKN